MLKITSHPLCSSCDSERQKEFELEDQGRPVENLRTVARSPFCFPVKTNTADPRSVSIDLEAIVPSLP